MSSACFNHSSLDLCRLFVLRTDHHTAFRIILIASVTPPSRSPSRSVLEKSLPSAATPPSSRRGSRPSLPTSDHASVPSCPPTSPRTTSPRSSRSLPVAKARISSSTSPFQSLVQLPLKATKASFSHFCRPAGHVRYLCRGVLIDGSILPSGF